MERACARRRPRSEAEGRMTCNACPHHRKPGRVDVGYCAGDRPDLEPAYGPNHPLKKLPADGGKNCKERKGL